MSQKLKWELHIVGEDLVSETATLIEIVAALRANNLPGPSDFTTTHLNAPTPALPVEPVIGLPPDSVTAPAEPAKRPHRRRAREPEPEVTESEPEMTEPEEEEVEEAGITANGTDALDMLTSLTGAEAREKALVLLRLSYAAPDGGADKVKALQKHLKIAKFADVPDSQGHALLASAIAIATEFGLVVP